MAKNPPANAGDADSVPGLEDPMERKWQPTPIFLPGKSCGQRSLVGYRAQGRRVGHDWVTKQQKQHNEVEA